MNKEEILVCITNHNNNDNALVLKHNFNKHFDTIIIDSESDVILNGFDIKLNNVYYTGLFNESVKQAMFRNKIYIFFIASDVYYYDYDKVADIIESLDDDIYLWAPASRGQSHKHCKNQHTNGFREVPYLEGFCFLTHIECCDKLYPVKPEENLYGYGIDLVLGYNCIKRLNKKCVIDDRIEIYHKEGTGYDRIKAMWFMYKWMIDIDEGVREYASLYSTAPGHEALLKKLKEKV